MAEQEEDGNRGHQSGQLKLSILNMNVPQGQRLCAVTAAHRYHSQSYPTISCHVTKRTHYHNEHKQRTWLF